MAFSRDGWNPIGGQSKKGTAPQMYSYTSTDAIADLNSAAYFNNVSDEVLVGDLIYCVTSTGGTAVATLVYVLTNASGVVDVNDGTTLAATDSD